MPAPSTGLISRFAASERLPTIPVTNRSPASRFSRPQPPTGRPSGAAADGGSSRPTGTTRRRSPAGTRGRRPRRPRPACVIPSGPSPPWNRFRPRRFHRLKCRWSPFPTRPANTTGANETASPFDRATARIVWRATRLVSASAIAGPVRHGDLELTGGVLRMELHHAGPLRLERADQLGRERLLIGQDRRAVAGTGVRRDGVGLVGLARGGPPAEEELELVRASELEPVTGQALQHPPSEGAPARRPRVPLLVPLVDGRERPPGRGGQRHGRRRVGHEPRVARSAPRSPATT